MILRTIQDRKRVTVRFMEKVIDENQKILDLGGETTMSVFLGDRGYILQNTASDIDFDYLGDSLAKYDNVDVVTAFEVLEHLFAPLDLLEKLPADKLILTVPLKLWFSKAYMHVPVVDGGHVAYGHYHEFEPEQLHMLLDKSGWEIKYSEKWKAASRIPLGIRPLLRNFTDRFYAVYCEKCEPYKTGNYKVTTPV